MELVNVDKCHACDSGSLCESIDGCHKFVNLLGLKADGVPLNNPSVFGRVGFDSSNGNLRFEKMEAFRKWRESSSIKKKATANSATPSENGECTNRFRALVDSRSQKKFNYKGVYSGVCRHGHCIGGCTIAIDTVK